MPIQAHGSSSSYLRIKQEKGGSIPTVGSKQAPKRRSLCRCCFHKSIYGACFLNFKTIRKMAYQFKLIKEYPNSEKAGTIFTIDERGQYVKENPLVIIQEEEIKNYPEFWEEVKECKPILITEDGKEIYDNDKYWLVESDLIITQVISDIEIRHTKLAKTFSTLKKAEEYIKWNKPMYSLNDIQNATFGNHEVIEYLQELGRK